MCVSQPQWVNGLFETQVNKDTSFTEQMELKRCIPWNLISCEIISCICVTEKYTPMLNPRYEVYYIVPEFIKDVSS